MSTIDRLEIKVQASAQKANTQLDLLTEKLNKVSASLSGVQSGGLNQLSSSVNHLANAMKNMGSVRATDFTRIANGIQKISNIDNQAIYKAANAIRNISNSISGMSITVPKGVSDISTLATAISRLGYKSTSNAIENIPKLAKAMLELTTTLSKAPMVSKNVIELTNSLSNLASQGNKVASASKSVEKGTKSASDSTKEYSKNAKNAGNSTASLRSELMKLYAIMTTIKGIASTLWNSAKLSMDYGETVNLFQTAFKKIGSDDAVNVGYEAGSKQAESYARGVIDEAEKFNEELSNALSLNPDEMMNYQAIFGQISNAIGLAKDSTMTLSESFTMLGTDMASLFNDDISTSMNKLQQGLVGQVRGLREYGIDITEATLQTYAYKYGIEDSVSKMSQAAKVQLRYLAIMDQGKISMGDMSKTINSSANQVRILQQNWNNLCRSIGNVFMPIIQNVLPYLNGLLIAIRNITDAFAVITGYSTPDYKDSNASGFSGVANDLLEIGDAENSVGDSAEDTKKKVDSLNKSLAKFDELNDIGKQSNSGKKGSTADGDGGYSQLDEAMKQVNSGYLTEFQDQLDKTGNKAKEIAEKIQPKIEAVLGVLDKFEPAFKGIAMAFATYKIIDLFSGLATNLASLGGTKEGIIALVISGLAGIGAAIYECWEKAKETDLEKRFGNIKLSPEESETVANRIVDNGTFGKLKTAMSSWDELKETKDNIDKAVETLNKYNWKVSIGMELTEAEQDEYKQAIQTYITESQKYIEQQQLAVLMSIDLLIRDDDTKARMIETSTEFYSSAQGELEKLGKDLNECVTNAWSDGLLDIDEAKEIAEIQGQMASVMEEISISEFETKLEMIRMDFSGAELDHDSFEKLVDKMQETVDEASENGKEITAKLVTQAKLELKKGIINQEEYNQRIDEIEKGRLSNIGEITLNATKFNLNSLYDTFGTELETKLPDFQKSLSDNVDKWFDLVGEDGLFEGEWGRFFSLIEMEINDGYKGLDATAKANLSDFLEQMKPTKEELENQAKQWLEMGESVPKNVSDGLASIYYLEAVSGNSEAIFSLIGMIAGESEERTQMIEKAKQSGVDFDKNIILGMRSSTPDVEQNVKDLIDGIDTKITSQTESVSTSITSSGEDVGQYYGDGIASKKGYAEEKASSIAYAGIGDLRKEEYRNDAKESGKALGESYGNGILSKSKFVGSSSDEVAKMVRDKFKERLKIDGKESSLFSTYGKYTVDGFNSGVYNNSSSTEKKISSWTLLTEKALKDELGIKNSISEHYETYGKYTVSGFNSGIENEGSSQKSKSVISTWVGKVKGWFTDLFDIHSPSRVFKQFGGFTVEGYNEGIEKNIGTTQSSITKWSNAIKDSASKITINPLEFKSNYTVNTSGIEGYSDFMKDSTVTMRAMESINIDQTSNSLNELPRMVTQAILQGLRGASFPATITQREVVSSVKSADIEQYGRTGVGIFQH